MHLPPRKPPVSSLRVSHKVLQTFEYACTSPTKPRLKIGLQPELRRWSLAHTGILVAPVGIGAKHALIPGPRSIAACHSIG